MELYSSTIIHYHLNVIKDLLMVMMDNNTCMLRYLENIENMMHASSKTIPDTPQHSDLAVSLHDKYEPEEFSEPLVIVEPEIDSDLDKEFSNTMHNSEEDNSRNCACKVFIEIPDREINMEVANSMRSNSVNPETQVSNEMFQPVSAVKYASSHFIIFDDPLALQCLLTASSHDQPISMDIFDYLSERYRAKSLCRFPTDQFGLDFPFDPGSRFLTTCLGGIKKYICRDMLDSLTSDMLMLSTLWNRLMRLRGTLLTGSLVFFIKFVATVSAYIIQAIFHGSVGLGIDKLVQQWGVNDVHQYSSNGLRTVMHTVSAIWSSVKEGDVIAATLKLYPPRIYDSMWVAAARMKKKKHNGNHSWNYTMLHEQQT
ncbi:uncharacterized protein LOC142176633 [Nicotiana tabacum]|uniref:Uncharacterized protein LOC142176633 n=1 Tax=Nicotiana tabacum TaxID=4097 RepID=A0AC58TU96_TOBAC